MAKVAQRQIVASVIPSQGQPNTNIRPPDFSSGSRKYFAQVSGGEVQASVEKVYDGGSSTPEALPAPIEVGDITVTRHYDPSDDGDLIDAARPLVGKARYDVAVFTLDPDNQIIRGRTRIYNRALLVNLSESEGDSSSGGPATFSMTFSCENVANTGS
jgi:hypothetical protein